MEKKKKKCQVGKERVLSSGGRAVGKAGEGEVERPIPMRLGNVDFSDLGGLWPYCVWKGAFKSC